MKRPVRREISQLFLEKAFITLGKSNKPDACSITAFALADPLDHAASMATDSFLEPDQARLNLFVRLNAQADNADIQNADNEICSRQIVKGDD